MKTLLLAGVIVVVMGGLVLNAKFGQPVEVTNTKLEETTVEVVDCMAVVMDEDACKAAQDVIDRKAAEQELEALEASFEALTATYEAERATYLEAKEELEKFLGSY
jgi:hypothetical protein